MEMSETKCFSIFERKIPIEAFISRQKLSAGVVPVPGDADGTRDAGGDPGNADLGAFGAGDGSLLARL